MGYENIVIVPLIRDYSEMPRLPGFDERRDVVFIGGFEHTPNVDAVRWLVDEIWPAVRVQCKEKGLEPIKLKLVGSKMLSWMKEIDAPDIEPIGYVEDLDALFCGVRLSIAPLRYGAGLKGKVATSLGYGVPVVGTDMAFEGMPEDTLDSVALIGNDPAALAGRILDHYTEQSAWQDVSKAGVQYVNQHYSVGAIAKHIAMFL
jgi:glycosyltransferase involved in cell wall biosynthesis